MIERQSDKSKTRMERAVVKSHHETKRRGSFEGGEEELRRAGLKEPRGGRSLWGWGWLIHSSLCCCAVVKNKCKGNAMVRLIRKTLRAASPVLLE